VQEDYSTLKKDYESLREDHLALESDYKALQEDFEKLQEDYNELKEDYEELTQSQENWKNMYDSLYNEYTALKAKYDALQEETQELQAKIDELENLLKQYESVPHNYYETDLFYSSGTAAELMGVLRQAHEMLARDYKENVFDCSESAAFIEWVLEDAGYDAYIVVGPAPWDPEGYHAWVLAYTTDGYVAAIECTITTSSRSNLELEMLYYGIIDANHPYAKGYYEGYDMKFKNIYLAIRHYGKFEWNWWEGYWGFD